MINDNKEINDSLVSICLITYNQEDYILEALEGAITQTYKNLEIIISDDHSSDSTFDIIKSFVEKHKKSFKFIISRNITNLGIAANVNRALELSSGKYIILAAGDDISLPDRVNISIETIQKRNAYSVTFNANIIDSNSVLTGTLFSNELSDKFFSINDYLHNNIVSSGSTRIINRNLLEIFGNINNDCPTEDSIFNFRAILAGGLAFCNIPIVNYRIHGNNLSNKKSLMLKIDPIKIHKQYHQDLEIAYEKNLISKIDYYKLNKHINHYKDWEIGIRRIYSSNSRYSKLKNFMQIFSFSKFSVKENLILFKTAALS